MGADRPVEPTERLEPLIFTVRCHRVILDADLARVYGVATKALNQAVKRNSERFPEDFAFRLDAAEAGGLRSRIQNRSQIVTGSQKHRDPTIQAWVFSDREDREAPGEGARIPQRSPGATLLSVLHGYSSRRQASMRRGQGGGQ